MLTILVIIGGTAITATCSRPPRGDGAPWLWWGVGGTTCRVPPLTPLPPLRWWPLLPLGGRDDEPAAAPPPPLCRIRSGRRFWSSASSVAWGGLVWCGVGERARLEARGLKACGLKACGMWLAACEGWGGRRGRRVKKCGGGGAGPVGAGLVALAEAIENSGDERQARRAVCEEYRLARAEVLLTLEDRLGLAPLARGGGGDGGVGSGSGWGSDSGPDWGRGRGRAQARSWSRS